MVSSVFLCKCRFIAKTERTSWQNLRASRNGSKANRQVSLGSENHDWTKQIDSSISCAKTKISYSVWHSLETTDRPRGYYPRWTLAKDPRLQPRDFWNRHRIRVYNADESIDEQAYFACYPIYRSRLRRRSPSRRWRSPVRTICWPRRENIGRRSIDESATYCFEEVIDVRSFVDKESNRMPFDLHGNDEVRRPWWLAYGQAWESIVLWVNQCFVEIQDENLLRQEIFEEENNANRSKSRKILPYVVDATRPASEDTGSIWQIGTEWTRKGDLRWADSAKCSVTFLFDPRNVKRVMVQKLKNTFNSRLKFAKQ